MTTAHRATWKPAHGGAGEDGSFALHAPSAASSARDAPSHDKLKTREPRAPALSRAEKLRAELAAREREAARSRAVDAVSRGELLPHENGPAGREDGDYGMAKESVHGELGRDDLESSTASRPQKRRRTLRASGDRSDIHSADFESRGEETEALDMLSNASPGDDHSVSRFEKSAVATTDINSDILSLGERAPEGSNPVPIRADVSEDDDDSVSDDDEDSEDDDPDALRAELDRIRAERAANRETEVRNAVASENPLLPSLGESSLREADGTPAAESESSFAVRRRWDDDVVFRNQAKREPKPEVRFINDTTRNDYHRKFLRRFIR